MKYVVNPVLVKFLLTLLVFSFSNCSSGYRDVRTAEAERAIREEPGLKRIDDICRSISLPSGSALVGKAWLSNYGGLIYFYSYNQELANIADHFENYFSSNGWEKTDTDITRSYLEYTKPDIRTSVQIGGIDSGTDYALYCGPHSTKDPN